jgi:uncharacterized membrane protein YqiK
MVIENKMFHLAVFSSAVIVVIILGLSYLFFERMITEEEIVITVINKEKFGTEDGKYLIFSKHEVFENSDKFFHKKTNAEQLYQKLDRGVSYRVKVAGLYIPSLNRLRNITEVVGTEVQSELKK